MNYEYIKRIENPIKAEELTSRCMYAVYSPYTSASEDTIVKLTEAEDENRLQKMLDLKVRTSETVEQALKQGHIVITHIDCYDACTTIIRTLRTLSEDATTKATMGYAIIVGTPANYTRSGLEKLFMFTAHCSLVYMDVDKDARPSKELEETYAAYVKAIVEEKKAYSEAKAKAKEADEEFTTPTVDSALPFVKGKEYASRLAWKMILSVADSLYFFTDTTTKLSSDLKSQILRDALLVKLPTYVVESGKTVKDIAKAVNFEKVDAVVQFYENGNSIKYDKNLFKEVLLGNKPKEKLTDCKFIEDLSQDLIDANKPHDYVKVTGANFACSKDKTVCIRTSILSNVSVNLTPETPEPILNYLEQVKTTLENLFSCGNTVMAIADNAYGVSVLREAYYHFAAHPESEGKLVILQGNIEEGPESEQYEAFIHALLGTGKVKVVESFFLPRTVTVPNTKKEKTEKDPDTLERSIKSDKICDLIAEQACHKSIFINAGLEDTSKCSPTVAFTKEGEAAVEVYNFKPEINVFTLGKPSFSKVEWYKEIPNKVDIKETLAAIQDAEVVKGF